MEIKKYELTDETLNYNGYILHRIKAVRDFGLVRAGDLGGWIEKEDNLSHEGNCWVYDEAKVYRNAVVKDNAKVFGDAVVYDNAQVFDDAQVYGYTEVCDNTKVYGDAQVYGFTEVSDYAQIYGHANVCGHAKVYGNAKVFGNAWVCDKAKVYDYARVYGNTDVFGYAEVSGEVWVFGVANVCDKVGGNERLCGANEKVYDDNNTPKNNTNMEKKYKVSINITMSKDIYVDAENEEEAKQKAIENAKENSYYLAGSADSCVNCVVTNIVNEDENVRLWLISQLKIKLDATNSDKNDMINKALDYLEKQGSKSVK